METLQHFGANLLLSIIGLLAYSLATVRKHIAARTFDFRIFWNHNIVFWIWAIICQVLYVSLMAFYPQLENWASRKLIAVVEAVLSINLDVPEDVVNTVVYLSLALLLAKLVNGSIPKKDKIGTKKTS